MECGKVQKDNTKKKLIIFFYEMINGIKRGFYFNIDGGDAKKSMVLATDVAKFIFNAAEVGGTYNFTDGYHPSFKDLSHYLAWQIGKKFVSNIQLFVPKILAKSGDIFGDAFSINSNKLSKIISTLTFDDSKARNTFGWDPTPILKVFKLYNDA